MFDLMPTLLFLNDSETFHEELTSFNLEVLLDFMHLRDHLNPTLPCFHIWIVVEHLSKALFSKYKHAVQFTEHLKVIACNNLATEVQLIVVQLAFHHRQNSLRELSHLRIDLCLCGLWFQLKLLGQ